MLNNLSVAVTPHGEEFYTTSSSAEVESHALLPETLSRIEIQSVNKIGIVNVTERGLQEAMGLYQQMEYDLENVDIKKNFVLVQTDMLHTVWNDYHNMGKKPLTSAMTLSR